MRTFLRAGIAAAAAASVAVLAMPAMAAGGPVDPSSKIVASTESGGAAAKGEKLICKTFDNTASRMKSTRLCYTKEQWKEFDETQR